MMDGHHWMGGMQREKQALRLLEVTSTKSIDQIGKDIEDAALVTRE